MIVEALAGEGIREKTILDIGCGVGGLHLTLLQRGARYSQGVEMAEGMLEVARGLADRMNLADRVVYHHGDFVTMNGGITAADIVILDKVVCCYPEFEDLITKSTAKTTSLYAVSYPRDALIPRMSFGGMAWLGRRLKWSFHPYYHTPAAIEASITSKGFREVFAGTTIQWSIKVFRRETAT